MARRMWGRGFLLTTPTSPLTPQAGREGGGVWRRPRPKTLQHRCVFGGAKGAWPLDDPAHRPTPNIGGAKGVWPLRWPRPPRSCSKRRARGGGVGLIVTPPPACGYGRGFTLAPPTAQLRGESPNEVRVVPVIGHYLNEVRNQPLIKRDYVLITD